MPPSLRSFDDFGSIDPSSPSSVESHQSGGQKRQSSFDDIDTIVEKRMRYQAENVKLEEYYYATIQGDVSVRELPYQYKIIVIETKNFDVQNRELIKIFLLSDLSWRVQSRHGVQVSPVQKGLYE